MHPQAFPIFAALALTIFRLFSSWQSKRRDSASHPLPPGPRPIPIIGNVLGVNPVEPWLSYTSWAKSYGNLVYSRLLNQDVITVNSEEIARDLLERRSHNYSDRPAIVCMVNDFFGWTFNSVMLPYGTRWRIHRRLLHQAFRHEVSPTYRPLQLRKARELVRNLLEAPENYYAHIQTYSASVIMSVIYGYETAHQDDPIVNVVNNAVTLATAAIRPEAAAFLGYFPFVRYTPSWFPGASFKRTALLSQKYADDMIEAPFRFVQENLATGAAVPCMVSDLFDRAKGQDTTGVYGMRPIKECSATAFAGSETTSSTLLIFILAMLLNPDVQTRAQVEIDSIVGTERLPTFDDRPLLPYIEAVLRETLRWHPVTPLGVPHATINADVYDGYFIPQGATVVVNIWAMSRNEAKYPDSEQYRPERFFDANGKLGDDEVPYVFGAGRRVCVGRHVAVASLWSAIAYTLAVFRITPCKDEWGNDVPVSPQWTTGITSHPLRFPCQFVPRIPGDSIEEKLTSMY